MKRFWVSISLVCAGLLSFNDFVWTDETGRFGVAIGGKGLLPSIVETLQDLGVSWVRANEHLDGQGQDLKRFLQAGINVVITMDNHDPSNIDTTYGTLKEFPNSGFPFKSKEIYQERIRKVLTPLLPYLKKGRQIWAQCENEVGDASVNPKARYWRGTMDQYLRQLEAFYEVVKSIDPSIPVVLTSFPSESLEAVINPLGGERSQYAIKRLTRLLSEGKYDAVDPHFYHCPETIPAKVKWVVEHMPKGKRWITTENGGPDFRCPTTPLHWKDNPEKYEQIQAKQVSERLSACAQNGGSICLWFSLLDHPKEVETFQHVGLIDQSALANRRGEFKKAKKQGKKPQLTPEEVKNVSETLRKKPAYEAFKSFVASYH